MEKKASDEILYKIEVAANRYDLLCEEGLVRALRIYVGNDNPPVFKTTSPKYTMTVEKEVKYKFNSRLNKLDHISFVLYFMDNYYCILFQGF